MNSKETLEILAKQWCDIHDLMKLTGLAKTRAYEIRKEMLYSLKQQGYLLPNDMIPMIEVVKKFKIDIDYLERMSKMI